VWQGSSQLPGEYTRDIVQGPVGPDASAAQNRSFRGLVAHELGHNLNAYHGGSWTCTDNRGKPVTIGSRCTLHQYGEPFTVMGDPWGTHVQRLRAGAGQLVRTEPEPDAVAHPRTGHQDGQRYRRDEDHHPACADRSRGTARCRRLPVPQMFRAPVPASERERCLHGAHGGGFRHAQDSDDRSSSGARRTSRLWQDDVDVNPGKGDDGVGSVKEGDQSDKDSGKKE
jgi:hypothetical protein